MRRLYFFSALLVLAAILAGCIGVDPQPPVTQKGGVRGFVYIRQGLGELSAGEDDVLFTVEPLASGEWTALSGAKIEVKNVSTGKKRFGPTEYDGYYEVRNLDVGYSILTVSHRALRHDVQTEVYVYPGEPTWVEDIYVSEPVPHYYFLIIGIENYADSRKSFPGPINDAERMYETLYLGNLLPGEGRRLVDSQATKNAIKNQIQTYVSKAQSTADHLIIYFSGFSGADYLSPYDDTGLGLSKKSITDAELESWLRDFPGYVTIIIDGSYSETMADGIRLEPLALKKRKYTVLTGAQSNQQVQHYDLFQGSVFTYFLWQGLRNGWADDNYDGAITPYELYDYTHAEMLSFYRDKDPSVRHYPFIHRGNSENKPIFKYR